MAPKKSKKKGNNFLPLVLAGLGLMILAVIGFYTFSDQAGGQNENNEFTFPPITVNQPAPDLTLQDLDGNLVSLSDYRGEVILLNNWATWCPPCKEEMPEFNQYYNSYKDQGFQVIAVEAGDPEQQVRAFVEENGIDFIILLDPENLSLKTYQNQSLPNSFVIDREGNLRLAWTGAINLATLEQYVTPLLEE